MSEIVEQALGWITLISFIGTLILMYHLHMTSVYSDIADEKAEEKFLDYVYNHDYLVNTKIVLTVEADNGKEVSVLAAEERLQGTGGEEMP